MATHNELTDIAINELKAHGIKGHLRDTDGGHIEIAWQVVPEKEVRRIIVAKTSSDWRARMNTRADVRRLLRADNVQLKLQTPKKQKPENLSKALALPQPVTISVPDQLAAIRSEVGDMTSLLVALTKKVSAMGSTLGTYVPPPPAPKPQSSRSVKLVEYLHHDRWISISALTRDTGLTPEQIKLKLHYLKTHEQVEIFRGEVRLKAAPAKKAGNERGKRPKAKPRTRPATRYNNEVLTITPKMG